MKYQNLITGAIIDVPSKINGVNWQAVKPVNAPAIEKKKSCTGATSKRKGKNENG